VKEKVRLWICPDCGALGPIGAYEPRCLVHDGQGDELPAMKPATFIRADSLRPILEALDDGYTTSSTAEAVAVRTARNLLTETLTPTTSKESEEGKR
jgi:hypothetical protein